MITAIQKMKASDESGFTLVELLIVIAIIAILAAIAIPQFAQYQQRAIRATMQSDAKNLATMEEATFGDSQSYSVLTAVVPSANGTAFSIGNIAGRTSKGNTPLIVLNGASGYAISITNGQAGTGSTNYVMDNAGAQGFVGP